MADEVRDAICYLIFVDKSCQIRAEFVQFLEYESGTSGQELYLKIVNVIRDLGLEIGNLRGQGYDGAGNMAGKKVVHHREF